MPDALAVSPDGLQCVVSPAEGDACLIRAAQADPTAFGLLYERYVDRVYAYLRMRTGSLEDTADLTQQVFLQALRALPRYRSGRVPFAAWLFRIAHNAAVNDRRARHSTVHWDLVPESSHPRVESDSEAHAIHREDMARVRETFQQRNRSPGVRHDSLAAHRLQCSA